MPVRLLTAIAFTVVSAVCWPLAAGPASSPAIVSTEFIYDTGPYPSVHASTLVETTSGQLLAAWFGGTDEGHPDVSIWVARHEKGRWSAGVKVADGVQDASTRHPTWNPVLFQPREGPVMLFYKVGPSPREWWGMLMTSADDGRTWSAPRRLPEQILGPIKNKPIQLADGTIVAGSSTEAVGTDAWRVHVERSHDLGRTWSSSRRSGMAASTRFSPGVRASCGRTPQLLCRRPKMHVGDVVVRRAGRRGARWSRRASSERQTQAWTPSREGWAALLRIQPPNAPRLPEGYRPATAHRGITDAQRTRDRWPLGAVSRDGSAYRRQGSRWKTRSHPPRLRYPPSSRRATGKIMLDTRSIGGQINTW